MKINKLLAMSTVVACGLTLASCGGTKVQVGLGYDASFSTTDPVLSIATAQLDLTSAFVAFDKKGAIVDARIDVVQVKVATNVESLLDTENPAGVSLTNTNVVDGSVTTKLELGKDYNMVNFGHAIAEVDAQIEAFADWTVGQTVEELKANVLADHGYGVAPHADLASSVTIVCHAFVNAIESAYNNRSERTYSVGETAQAGIAMVSGLAYNYGKPQTDISVDVAGVMVEEGKVVASQIDAIVYPLTVSKELGNLGTISANASSKYFKDGKITSKKSLGAEYAMAGKNGGLESCTLEWDEQAAIIEDAALEKTSAEIATLVVNEGDLTGATITLNSYVKALSKAANYAVLEHVGPQA